MTPAPDTVARPAGLRRDEAAFTGAQLAARALKNCGVRNVFALCGDQVNALFHAVVREGIDIIGARHESAAVQMADGWARATGKPGVAIVTGGPGHTNAITGAAVAQGAQSPVVIISGQATKRLRERGGNQSLHQADLMRPVTKWAVEAEDASAAGELVSRALALATSGTPGPVSVSIPVDVATSPGNQNKEAISPAAFTCATGIVSGRELDVAARLLASASRPVAVVGGNAWTHESPHDVAGSLRALGIPSFTNGQSRGVIPDDGKLCFGYANPLFNSVFRSARDADLILLVGTTLDYNLGSGRNRIIGDSARVLQIHRDATQIGIGGMPDAAVAGDHALVLKALASLVRGKRLRARFRPWRRALERRHAERQAYWRHIVRNKDVSRRGVHPAMLCRALAKYWTPDTTLVVDVGDFANWPKAYFPARRPARYMDGGALGNLGGSVPLAIGAQLAAPSSPVWAFIGDGGFGFHGWELSTAVERQLPVKFIVGHDSCWGTEKRLQRTEFGTDLACDLPAVRYDRFARLLGASAFHVSNESQLAAVVSRFVGSRGPSLLQVEITREVGRPFQGPAAASTGGCP